MDSQEPLSNRNDGSSRGSLRPDGDEWTRNRKASEAKNPTRIIAATQSMSSGSRSSEGSIRGYYFHYRKEEDESGSRVIAETHLTHWTSLKSLGDANRDPPKTMSPSLDTERRPSRSGADSHPLTADNRGPALSTLSNTPTADTQTKPLHGQTANKPPAAPVFLGVAFNPGVWNRYAPEPRGISRSSAAAPTPTAAHVKSHASQTRTWRPARRDSPAFKEATRDRKVAHKASSIPKTGERQDLLGPNAAASSTWVPAEPTLSLKCVKSGASTSPWMTSASASRRAKESVLSKLIAECYEYFGPLQSRKTTSSKTVGGNNYLKSGALNNGDVEFTMQDAHNATLGYLKPWPAESIPQKKQHVAAQTPKDGHFSSSSGGSMKVPHENGNTNTWKRDPNTLKRKRVDRYEEDWSPFNERRNGKRRGRGYENTDWDRAFINRCMHKWSLTNWFG